MLYLLRKMLEALMLPIGFAIVFSIAGLVSRRRWPIAASIAVLFAFSTAIANGLLMGPLERVYPAEPVAAAPNADAIVVLSGGIVRGVNAAGVQWGESASRYFAGYDLAMAGKAKLIVFTAANADDIEGPTQGAILRQVAIDHGVAPERILVTPHVLVTEDEARYVSKIPGIHSVLLVTSAYHMPRAAILFRARSLQVSPFPTGEEVPPGGFVSAAEFIPTAGHLKRSDEALREYYGLAVYRTLLWLHPSSLRR